MELLTNEEWHAIRLSLIVAFWVVALSLPVAVPLGYLLARRDFAAKWLVEVMVNLSLLLPPVVTGYLLLIVFQAEAPVGRFLREYFDVRIAFDWKGLVVAAGVMSFPLMARAVRLGFESVDPRLELAARTLGVGPLRTFFTISLPLARHGIVAGAVLAFARSLGEFGATVMLVSQRESTRSISLLIFSTQDRIGGFDRIWPLVTVSILLAAGALVASELLQKRARAR